MNISCTIKEGERFNEFTYSKTSHLDYFIEKNYDVTLYGEKIDTEYSNLTVYQDILIYGFIVENLKPGSKILCLTGRDSKIPSRLKNQYEFWNLDVDAEHEIQGIKLVRDSIGNFSKELPDNYFDLIYSVSALKHIPDNDVSSLKNIYEDLDRLSKIGSYNFHCFNIVIAENYIWTNRIVYYFFNRANTLNDFIPFDELRTAKDIYKMSEKFYNDNWKPITNSSYKQFGTPLSYSILWRKEKEEIDISMSTFLKKYKKRIPEKTFTLENEYSIKNPSYIFHHLIKCGGTSVFSVINKWFSIESDYRPEKYSLSYNPRENINLYNKYKLNLESFSSDKCLVSHFNTQGCYLHQRYPEISMKKETIKIFTFVRDPLDLAISLFYYKIGQKQMGDNNNLKDFLNYSYNLLSLQFPCDENNYMEILDRYFFIGLVDKMQESFDKLANITGKRRILLPLENRSKKDEQIEEIKNDAEFIKEFKERNYIDYLVYEYCRERYYSSNDLHK